MRAILLATILGVVGLGFAASTAEAHGRGKVYAGFGNGPHDYVPHWHKTTTPFGPVYWYGNGLHDYLPHHHTFSPYSGVRSYSLTPFGPTKSYNGFPYYNGSYGGYAPYYGDWGW